MLQRARDTARRAVSALYHDPRGFQLLRASRIVRHPLEFRRRKHAARKHVLPRDLSVDEELGYRWVAPQEISGYDAMLARVNERIEEVRPRIPEWRRKKGAYHATTFDLLSDELIDRMPEVIDFALAEELLGPVLGYLGTLPVLRRVSIGYSSNQGEPHTGSMFYHLDGEDSRQLKLFVLLSEVALGNGPMHFYSAQDSRKILRRLPRARPESPHVRAFGPYRDEDVERVADGPPLIFDGLPGHALLIDTSRCLHFGARISNGLERLALMLVYRRMHSVHETPFNVLRPDRFQDPLRRALLQGTERLPLNWYFPDPSLGPEARGGGRQ